MLRELVRGGNRGVEEEMNHGDTEEIQKESREEE